MKVTLLTDKSCEPVPCVATVGFFDGVHRGHRYLIEQVTAAARRSGTEAAAVTFDRHPRRVLQSGFSTQMLGTLDERIELLSATGIDRCVVLPFDETVAAMPAREFMATVLRDAVGVQTLVMGYDNRFGHGREAAFDDCVGYGRELGIGVVRAQPFILNGVNVSSSVIRAFLTEGEVSMAAMCLGRSYSLTGRVVSGRQIGRSIGFPTANIEPADADRLVPAAGVYAVRVMIGGDDGATESFGRPHAAMMNIGTRPTFGGSAVTLEVHIIGFSGDIYGRQMRVEFVKRLRGERKFRNGAELAAHLRQDAVEAEAALGEPGLADAGYAGTVRDIGWGTIPSDGGDSDKRKNELI